MGSKLRYNSRRNVSFIFVFLAVDLLLIFGLLKTSSATYVSEAIGEAPMDVALYAFSYDGLYDVTTGSNEAALDINLGSLKPGDVKYYSFKVTNAVANDDDENIKSDTNIIYKLKVITTTNINLKYSLYYEQDPRSTSATDLFMSGGTDIGVYATDGWGTWFKHYAIPAKCLKKESIVVDDYILKVEFPVDYKDYNYQDMVESIKIQLESKQVITGDADENLCR
jgi:hypothetical protein